MPLIAKLPPAMDPIQCFESPSLHVHVHVHHQLEQVREEQESIDDYAQLEEYNDQEDALDSDMDGSILHRPRPKKPAKAPVLPQRSQKRTSKILEGVLQELQTLETDASKDQADSMSLVQESDPHEHYLSSEEDASLSDDYEGSLMDFEQSEGEDARGQSSRSSRRKSQEDTARVVSFMVVKPQIVNILTISPANSAPTSRQSMNLDGLTSFKNKPISTSPKRPMARRPPPLTLYPASRRMSTSSTTSYIPSGMNSPAPAPMRHQNASTSNLSMLSSQSSHAATSPAARHPARKSSRMGFSQLTSLVISHSAARKASFNSQSNPTPITASSTHSFLNSDPFANSHRNQQANHNLPPSPSETPTTPKTPNSLANWKKGLTRSLSKARKQSMPKLAQTYKLQPGASSSTLSLASTATATSHATHARSSTSHGPHSTSTIPTLSSFNSSSTSQLNSISADTASITQSTTNLVRVASNPEPTTPKLLDTMMPTMHEQMAVKRSETMPVLQSPRDSAPPRMRYEDIVARGAPPIPGESREVERERGDGSAKSVKDWRRERRSFGLMGGLGRKKSVRK